MDIPAECQLPPGFASLGELEAAIEREVIRPCLALAFRADELRGYSTALVEFDGLDPGTGVALKIETTAGETQGFYVWQPGVESLSTIAGMRKHLLGQMEDWLPESRHRWGEEVRLVDLDD